MEEEGKMCEARESTKEGEERKKERKLEGKGEYIEGD